MEGWTLHAQVPCTQRTIANSGKRSDSEAQGVALFLSWIPLWNPFKEARRDHI